MSEPSQGNNPTELVRAVLCAMLISMLFSFVVTDLSGSEWAKLKQIPQTFSGVWTAIAEGHGANLMFAGVWFVFYFGYLVDDYIHIQSSDNKRQFRHLSAIGRAWSKLKAKIILYSLIFSWFLFFAQVCTVMRPAFSAKFGMAGLIALSISLLFETCTLATKGKGWRLFWLVENISIFAAITPFCSQYEYSGKLMLFAMGSILVEKFILRWLLPLLKWCCRKSYAGD